MRKIDPPPELTGWDFIIAGLVSVGTLLVMIVVGTLSDPGATEVDELDGAATPFETKIMRNRLGRLTTAGGLLWLGLVDNRTRSRVHRQRLCTRGHHSDRSEIAGYVAAVLVADNQNNLVSFRWTEDRPLRALAAFAALFLVRDGDVPFSAGASRAAA